MKILIIMAVLSAAIALNTAQSASDSAHISAAYPGKLELVLPDGKELHMQDVSPGKEAKTECVVIVRANVDWALKVDGEYEGKMQKVTNKSQRLKNRMKVKYTGTTLQLAETLLSGRAENYCFGPPGEISVPTEFKQEFTWTDVPANYQMKIYFRLSPS
jgi:hypothetical protein